ncbi:MAG: hypothetical protein O3C21_06740 [Verrucomicrobia bacterium]|nr:hypothetical protein [Verrucomicrobiota bacterium]
MAGNFCYVVGNSHIQDSENIKNPVVTAAGKREACNWFLDLHENGNEEWETREGRERCLTAGNLNSWCEEVPFVPLVE